MAMMNPGQLQIRRATVDDLPALRELWLAAKWNAEELENRLTDFHIVQSGGQFAGALGVQVVRQHARLHSEDYADFAVADDARKLFWDRIQVIAANLGVFRLWTQETSPFWTRWGFQPPDAETLARLPEEWKNLEGRWLTLQLKDADVINKAMETQFAGFMDAEKKQTARVLARAKMVRVVFVTVCFAIFFICVLIFFYEIMRRAVPTP